MHAELRAGMESAAMEPVAVVVCTCGGTLCSDRDLEGLVAVLADGAPGGAAVFTTANLCSQRERKAVARQMRKQKSRKAVCAGCPFTTRPDVLQSLAREAGLAPSGVLPVNLRPLARRRGAAKVREASRRIQQAARALELMPAFQTRKISVEPRTLVIGAGAAGAHAALELHGLGLPVTVVEQAATLGRYAHELLGGGGAMLPREPEVLTGSRVLEVHGHVGRFEVRISTPRGAATVRVGAVVVAAGIPAPDRTAWPYEAGCTVPLQQLGEAVFALPPQRRIRSICMLLDAVYDENKAGMERALELALELHDPAHRQLHLLCRDARVASLMLETLYDRVREAGVDIARYEGSPSVTEAGEAVVVGYRDAVLGEEVMLRCDLVGLSDPGVSAAADAELAALLGITTDGSGQLQENNVRLFPELTNRQGIFVAGSCRGQHHLPEIRSEARAAALAVHALLAPGVMEMELSSPVVDADKCVLCLTCVRACPFGAMEIDHDKGAAVSVPEACRRCGICAGECPARAIELPAWSDAVLYSLIGSR